MWPTARLSDGSAIGQIDLGRFGDRFLGRKFLEIGHGLFAGALKQIFFAA